MSKPRRMKLVSSTEATLVLVLGRRVNVQELRNAWDQGLEFKLYHRDMQESALRASKSDVPQMRAQGIDVIILSAWWGEDAPRVRIPLIGA